MNLNCNGSLMELFAEINKFRLLVEKAFNELLKSFKLASIVKLYAITNKLLPLALENLYGIDKKALR